MTIDVEAPEFLTIEHMSVSRHGVWKLCQQQYKYKYHLKVVSDSPEPTAAHCSVTVYSLIHFMTLTLNCCCSLQCLFAHYYCSLLS